ncbi:hypothetical protein B0H17DRAFT_1116043 [Mycena rosella]|uniref:Uncharacterized protein n=1 Tax=Mycena rosella TaxID=1033263 RepID=A0AAD7B9R0_MYCRO|nr:hypothetical protein B0H17DRAFT_1116043 [Mycena rosella]
MTTTKCQQDLAEIHVLSALALLGICRAECRDGGDGDGPGVAKPDRSLCRVQWCFLKLTQLSILGPKAATAAM